MCYFREWGQLYNITESDTIPVQFKMLSCLHLDGSSLDVLWVFPWRYIHWFSFLVEISFHLSFCISYFLRANNIHCLYFFYYICGSYVLACWVGFSWKTNSCYTHLYFVRRYFLLFLSVFDACFYVFIWCIIMYAFTNLCISRSNMISDLIMRHSHFNFKSYFDVFILLFYPFMFWFLLHVECFHIMSLHVASY